MVVDDDHRHITKLILQCGVDAEHPRTELLLTGITMEKKEKDKDGKEE